MVYLPALTCLGLLILAGLKTFQQNSTTCTFIGPAEFKLKYFLSFSGAYIWLILQRRVENEIVIIMLNNR